MTPSPAAPDTLLLGIWSADGHAAATGAVRDWAGATLPDVLAATGQLWTILVQALEAAALIDVGNVVILSNSADLVRALSPPFAPPPPSQRQRIYYSRTEWVDVGWGGDPQHWQALTMLGGRWGGRFRAMVVAEIPKARELWEQSQY